MHIAQESDKKIVIYAQGSRGRRAMTAAAPPIYKIILKMKFNFKFNYICHLWEAAFIVLINKVQDQEYNAPFGFLRTGACAPATF